MDNFEDKLNNIVVSENEPSYKKEILANLEKQLFEKPNYLWHFRITLSTSLILLIFLIVAIVKPNIPNKINEFAFSDKKTSSPSQEEFLNTQFPMIENIKYTSIFNPTLEKEINPLDFKEETSYIIRKYKSNNETITIISEFENGINSPVIQAKIQKTSGSF